MTNTPRQFIKFKRWRLRDGRQELDLLDLVRAEIIPHYRGLPGCLRLGLLHVNGTRAYLAIQYWESREAHDRTIGAAAYQAWWREYAPVLARWNDLMELESEWDADDLLGNIGENVAGST